MVCPRGYIITLVAFVWLFSTVRLQMCSQISYLWGCKVTLVTFIWLFSAVCLQMSSQIACQGECKVTLVAFVWFFPTVCLQMYPQMNCLRGCIATLVCIVLVSNWERRKIANSDEQQMKVKLIFKNNVKYIAMHILSNVCIKTFNF